ncbi:hypothetical protein EC988_009826, partial [Linderina pennispora]
GAVFTQILADVTGAQVVVPRFVDSAVVLGSAILGYTAAKPKSSDHSQDLWNAMAAMTGDGSVIRPTTDAGVLDIHERKYRVMLEMQQDQLKYRRMMQAE